MAVYDQGGIHLNWKALFLSTIVGFVLASCTGIHIAPHLGGTNTNPTQEYAFLPPVYYRGGMLYHKYRSLGQVGDARAAKEGEACSYSVLWLAAWGDSSLSRAQKQGGISKIASVEYENSAILGFVYHRFCTFVRGK